MSSISSRSKKRGPYIRYDWSRILPRVKELKREYKRMGIKPSLRAVFYRLVSERLLPNLHKCYHRLATKLKEEREIGLEWVSLKGEEEEVRYGIDPDAFEDPSRRVIGGDIGFSSIEEYFNEFLDYMERSYIRRRWENQPKQVIMWLEKEALAGVLENVAKKYRVKLIPAKGYASFTCVFKHLVKEIDLNKPLVILLFTDFDPSGQDMVKDLRKRVSKYIFKYYAMDEEDYDTVIKVHEDYVWHDDYSFEKIYVSEGIEVKKVALTRDQVIKYNLPPIMAKESDPRFHWFKRTYGDKATELDALPPAILKALAERAILENIDVEKWRKTERIEREERRKIKEIVQKLRETLEFDLS